MRRIPTGPMPGVRETASSRTTMHHGILRQADCHARPAAAGVSGTKVVVDASIVMKWFLPEAYANEARRLTTGAYDVLVPDLMFSELGALLKRRISLGEITEDEALQIFEVLDAVPLRVHRTWSLALAALDVERRVKRAVCHSVHLALAVTTGSVLVTADRHLFNAVRGKSLARHVRWIEDVA